jgi:hypothetical protein
MSEPTQAVGAPLERQVRPGFAEWHGGRYAGLQLDIAQAAWDVAVAHCMDVLDSTQMTARLAKAAVDPDTGEAYYDHDKLDAIIGCLSECMDEIAGPNDRSQATAVGGSPALRG